MLKRNVLSSPRLTELKKKKRRGFLRRVLIITLGFIVVFGILSYVSRNAKININTIEISGNKIIDTGLIKNIVDEQLTGYYLKIFPKTNFIFYPKTLISNELGIKLKRLKNISLSLKDVNTLLVSVSERTALYTWCGVNPPGLENSEQKCYFLDENGFVFGEAPYFSGEVYLRFYGLGDLNQDNPVGFYFSRKIFNNLILFKNEVEKMGLKAKAFYILPDGDIKMFLPSKDGTSKDPEVIFKSNADFNQVAENLQASLGTEPLQSKFKKDYTSLLYIDLRFGNKVYYKFK